MLPDWGNTGMRKSVMVGTMAFVVLAATNAIAQDDAPDMREADKALNAQAFAAIQEKHPGRALDLLAPSIARYDAQVQQSRKDGMAFCGTSPTEVILYAALPAAQKENGVVYGAEVCDSYFFRAFALMDLGRKADALAALQALTALSPMHGQYFIELGYAYRVNGQNDKAMAAYRSALQYAELEQDDAVKKRVRAGARRGIGYMLVEQRDLIGARKAYEQSLEDEPSSTVARSELQFIAEHLNALK